MKIFHVWNEVHVLTGFCALDPDIPGLKTYLILLKSVLALVESFFQVRKILRGNEFDVVHILVEPYILNFSLLIHKNILLNLVRTCGNNIFKQSSFRHLYRLGLREIRVFLSPKPIYR